MGKASFDRHRMLSENCFTASQLNTLFFLYFARRGVWEAHTRYQAPEGATSRKLTCFAAKLALGEVL